MARCGAAGLRTAVAGACAHDGDHARDQLSPAMRELLGEMMTELREVEARLKTLDQRLAQVAAHDERCQRLCEVPGVGPLISTALVATIGNAREFKSGRELSAYLGLVPRQHSSGGKTRLLGITKHGDRYLRTLLIHGARAVLNAKHRGSHPRAASMARLRAARGPTSLRSRWLIIMRECCGRCSAAASTTVPRRPQRHPQFFATTLQRWRGG